MSSKLPLLLETIKIEEGKVCNLFYHQERVNKSRKALFSSTDILMLQKHIEPPKNGLYRCRVLYDTQIQNIEYIPYSPKKIHTLTIVTSDLEYEYKYANRNELNQLLASVSSDDILIEKNGYLTDTSIANIAFYDGIQWFTPKIPLLKGTMRAKLLDEGFLKTREIKKEDLTHYTQVALMNAMIGFSILRNIEIQT